MRTTPMAESSAPDLASYDHFIVAFSGGKDSLACLLCLLDCEVPRSRIELWHHDVDGREGSTLMDWPCTRDYCRKIAAAFGVPIYFSWKSGGFEREMLRDGTATAPIYFEGPSEYPGERLTVTFQSGGKGPAGTRKIFPQVSANLSVRWCSAYLKIDVCATAIRNQVRFNGRRTLVVTGERAEESAARSKYKIFEPDRSDNRDGKKRRLVDHWRPVHAWKEHQIWEIIERYRVNPHPAYRLGWGRVSCAACIFGSPNQWASLRAVNPGQLQRIANYEAQFGKTIHRKLSVIQSASKGDPYPNMRQDDIDAALSHGFNEAVFMEHWALPAGAYGESCGPT